MGFRSFGIPATRQADARASVAGAIQVNEDPDAADVRRVLAGDVEAFDGIVRRGEQRLYSRRDRARLAYVLAGKTVGFSLEEVREMLLRRADAREKKQWALSDALRDQLLATVWQVKDTKEGQKLSRRG